jgi:hypothetical protein
MSAELQIQASLKFSKGGANIETNFPSSYFDVSGTVGDKEVQAIGTADEVLNLGDIATIGYVMLRNLDATNYISIGSDGTLYPIKLKPGEVALVRWNAAAIHAKANVAVCNLEYTLISD